MFEAKIEDMRMKVITSCEGAMREAICFAKWYREEAEMPKMRDVLEWTTYASLAREAEASVRDAVNTIEECYEASSHLLLPFDYYHGVRQDADDIERLQTLIEDYRVEIEEADEEVMWMLSWVLREGADAVQRTFRDAFEGRAKDTPRLEKASRMRSAYLRTTKAKMHISGFILDGVLYSVHSNLPLWTTCKPSSKVDDGFSLRFTPSKTQKKTLIDFAFCLGDAHRFEAFCTEYPSLNRGEAFELYYKKLFGYPIYKDDSAFWEGTDLPEKEASLKFEGASIVNERTAKKALESLTK